MTNSLFPPHNGGSWHYILYGFTYTLYGERADPRFVGITIGTTNTIGMSVASYRRRSPIDAKLVAVCTTKKATGLHRLLYRLL
jgi:hypothetical protein